jgi:DNA-binding transcriptional MerR regulator
MTNNELLSIGSFAMLSGLTIPALRHYDDVDVLKPVTVDPRTSYRYYSPDQVRHARLIRALRAVDLPVDEIRDVLAANDEEYIRGLLMDHRERLAQREHELTQQIEALDAYIEKGVNVTTEMKGSRLVMVNVAVKDLAEARRFYEGVFGMTFEEETHEGETGKHLQSHFGTWPSESFFLMQVFEVGGSDYEHLAGTSNLGFLVDDLDAAYKRALAAGAKDVHPPKDMPGMPRVAQIEDPSGNDIGLYQG